MELADKYLKTAIIDILDVLKKVEENMNIMGRDTEDIHKTQREFPEMNNTFSEMKNTLGGVNSQLDTAIECNKNIPK